MNKYCMRAKDFINNHNTKDSSVTLDPKRTQYEIRNYHKLDKYLEELCDLVEQGQDSDKDFGMVAAGLLPLEGNYMARLNRPGQDGKRVHAELAVIEDFIKKYGKIPEGSVLLTTLSPCTKHLDERDGPSCSSLVEKYGIQKVYCGYLDPTQIDDHRDYNLMETSNESIRKKCKAFADTFLDDVKESLTEFSVDDDGDEERRLFKYARMWYHGNSHIQHKVEKILDRMGWEIGPLESEEGGAFVDGKRYIGFSRDELSENFADGRHPEDKGDSKRYNVPTKASVSTLRKIAHQGGRRGQLAHWMANMKSGKKK